MANKLVEDIRSIPSWVWFGGAAVVGVLLIMGKLNGSGVTTTSTVPSSSVPVTADTTGGTGTDTTSSTPDTSSNTLSDALNQIFAAQGQENQDLLAGIQSSQEQFAQSVLAQQQSSQDTFVAALGNLNQSEQQQYSTLTSSMQGIASALGSQQSQINTLGQAVAATKQGLADVNQSIFSSPQAPTPQQSTSSTPSSGKKVDTSQSQSLQDSQSISNTYSYQPSAPPPTGVQGSLDAGNNGEPNNQVVIQSAANKGSAQTVNKKQGNIPQ